MERRLHFIFYFIAYVEPYLFKRYTILWSGFIYGNYVDLKLKNVSMHIYTYILVQPQYSACNWLLESIELKTTKIWRTENRARSATIRGGAMYK